MRIGIRSPVIDRQTTPPFGGAESGASGSAIERRSLREGKGVRLKRYARYVRIGSRDRGRCRRRDDAEIGSLDGRLDARRAGAVAHTGAGGVVRPRSRSTVVVAARAMGRIVPGTGPGFGRRSRQLIVVGAAVQAIGVRGPRQHQRQCAGQREHPEGEPPAATTAVRHARNLIRTVGARKANRPRAPWSVTPGRPRCRRFPHTASVQRRHDFPRSPD